MSETEHRIQSWIAGHRLFLGWTAGMLWVAIIVWITKPTPQHIWQAEAIRHGAAAFVCDATTGECVFRWNDESE